MSTNDAALVSAAADGIALGAPTADSVTEISAFDKYTTIGAIEYIVALVRRTWDCPIVFYTNARFASAVYGDMVQILNERIKPKWNIHVIDLFGDVEFNDIPRETYSLYMLDDIHPTKAGYREWWLPEFEKRLKHLS